MKSKWLSGPYVIWMLLFTLIPLGVVFYFAFTDLNGSFTLHNLSAIGNYLPIFLRSAWLSLVSTAICLVIGYPVAYCIAQATPARQKFYYMLDVYKRQLPHCHVGSPVERRDHQKNHGDIEEDEHQDGENTVQPLSLIHI